MASYRPIDSKREEFRKYLERAGVMDALTRVLVSLYEEPEKPEDALEYVRVHLGSSAVDPQELENVKTELQAALDRIHALEEENASLKEKLGITSETEGEAQPPEAAPTEEALESSGEVPASTEEAPASEAEQEPTEEAPALPPEETSEEPPESPVEQVVEELPPEEPAQ